MSEIYLRKDFIETLEPEEVVIYTALKKEIDERYKADEESIIINTSIDFIYYGLTNSWECPRKLKDNLSNGLKGLINKGLITLISSNKNNYVIEAKELYINSKTKDTPYFITTSCKCQYKIAQKVENKNVQFIPLNPHSGFRETLVFP